MTLKAGALITVLGGLPLLAPATAHADYLYEYQGGQFDYGLGGYGSTFTPPTENLTASIHSPTALAPNTTYDFVNPFLGSSSFNNFSVNLGSGTYAAYGPYDVSGAITTNSNGAISSWSFFVGPFTFPGSTIAGSNTATIYAVPSVSPTEPSYYTSVPLYDAVYESNGLAGPNYVEGSTTQGAWSISAVPLPSTVWLLLGGLGTLGLLARHPIHRKRGGYGIGRVVPAAVESHAGIAAAG